MQFQGDENVEELSQLLGKETDRSVVIVAAAFFEETLGRLLGDTGQRSFYARINEARDRGILTQNEHDDLHKIRDVRNKFAHELRTAAFDAKVTHAFESMATWKVASSELPRYEEIFSVSGKSLRSVRTTSLPSLWRTTRHARHTRRASTWSLGLQGDR
jgi:hypothetical protein